MDGRDGVSVYQREGPFEYVALASSLPLSNKPFSVVLLDLSMPVLDGKLRV